MCGIFGAISQDGSPDPAMLRALTLANRERGNQALGYFTSDSDWLKCAGDPLEVMTRKQFRKFINRFANHWYVVGHTRFATRGANTTNNAHPFTFGKFTGVHNGCVTAPMVYTVDSQYLIDQLHEHAGDYQKALEDISGTWGLAWSDSASLYLQCHRADLAIGEYSGAWYFSSDAAHLRACGVRSVREMASGETLRFTLTTSGGSMEKLARFNCKAQSWYSAKCWWNTDYASDSRKALDDAYATYLVPVVRRAPVNPTSLKDYDRDRYDRLARGMGSANLKEYCRENGFFDEVDGIAELEAQHDTQSFMEGM